LLTGLRRVARVAKVAKGLRRVAKVFCIKTIMKTAVFASRVARVARVAHKNYTRGKKGREVLIQMPVDWGKYPSNWKTIALTIKKNADWKCGFCGKQCRKPNEKFDNHKRTATVAHLNHIEMDCRPINLICACAPCHLRYDSKHHAATRKKNRRILDKQMPLPNF